MKISDYFLYKDFPDSNRLIIVFSGRNARNFNLYKILENIPINKIFIRDPAGCNWYNSSFQHDEGWVGIDELIEKINFYVKKFDPDNVYITGGSMGGYAALLTAFKLNIDKCLIFSPQITLDYRLPNNPSKDLVIKYKNAFEFCSSKSKANVKIILGADEIADIYNLVDICKKPGVEIFCVKSAPHNALHFLHKNNLLSSIVSSFLNDEELDVILPLFDFFKSDSFVKLIKKIVEGFYFESSCFEEINQYIDEALGKAPFWAALPYIRAKLYEKFNYHEDAIFSFENAIRLSPENSLFHFDFGALLLKIKLYARAESEYKAAIKYSESENHFLYHKIGICCLLQKKYDESYMWQKKAIEINLKFSPAYYQLGLIENIRGNYSNAVFFFEKAVLLKDRNQNLKKHLETAKRNIGIC